MVFTKDKLSDFNYARSLEWLETNGLGGYASSTVSGAHSRRYHGLLVASMHPPVCRTVILSKLEETIVLVNQRFELSANQFGGIINPQGFQYLDSYERNLFPTFIFETNKVRLKKTIAAIHNENTTLIIYEVLKASEKFVLELLPLCSSRDYHSISYANDTINKKYAFTDGVFQTKNYPDSPELFIKVPNSTFEASGYWNKNFEYSGEQYHGLEFQEDLYNHGKFKVDMDIGDKIAVIISTENPSERDAIQLFNKEEKRREELVANNSGNTNLKHLLLAADQFVVKRGNELKTVIAGYHWFSDWGRDTMISLPGLCLVTKRYEDAKKILQAFAESVSDGMLPNRFSDFDEAPDYNTVDATLWYFNAIYKYYQYTKDNVFVYSLIPVLLDIIEWHYRGTRYNIHVDTDELLYSGQKGVQLTWMDAKVGDYVVTPRIGKAVEINALWYNALSIMEELLAESGDQENAIIFNKRALRVYTNFNELFWNKSLNYLYDFVDGDYKNDDLRPNQIYAISLPFSLLSKDKEIKVFNITSKKLLTPRGLRSLTPDHREFKAVYGGGQFDRDSAYHQGTVWSFLIGIYIDMLMKILGEKGKPYATVIIKSMLDNLDEAGTGTISEIFDAEPPYTSRGCIAQAWGVAEILRVVMEYNLIEDEKIERKNVKEKVSSYDLAKA